MWHWRGQTGYRTPWHYLTFHYLRLHFPSRWFPLASFNSWASLLALSGNNLPAMRENQVWSLGWNISLGKEMTTQFRILACKIPWIEDPDGLSLTCLRRIIGFICKGSYKLGMLKAQRTKPFSVDLGWTAGHSFRERRKAQDWEIARLIWLVFQKKKKKKKDKVFTEDLLSTELGIIHTTMTNFSWKVIFQLRSHIFLNTSAS